MSYELKIDPKRRAAGRFIGRVRKALITAALEEKAQTGLTQQKVADCLGVNRSVVNRMLRGELNLTLRTVAELAWAMGWEPDFTLSRKAHPEGANVEHEQIPSRAEHTKSEVLSQSSAFVHYTSAPEPVSDKTKNSVPLAAVN